MLHLAQKAFYPSQTAVSAAPRRHDLEVPGDDRVSRCDGRRLGVELIVHINQDGLRAAFRPVRLRLGHAHPGDEDRSVAAGAGQIRVRRGLRRRAARRGKEPRQGAHLFATARKPTPGTRATSARNFGVCSIRASSRANRCASSRCRIGRSSMSGNISAPETIPVVPLYFAKERPVVERDGTLIMVDDERLPLRAGRDAARWSACASARSAAIRFTGAIRSDADNARRHHRRNAQRQHVRAPGPADRSRRSGLDGKEKARRIFLMDQLAEISVLPEVSAQSAEANRLRCGFSPAARSMTANRR